MNSHEPRQRVIESPEEHTLVKRKILKNYMGAWLSILGQAPFHCLWYIDCYAGASFGRDGSPTTGIISVRLSNDLLATGKAERVNCINVEKEPDYYERLCAAVGQEGIRDQQRFDCPPLDLENWLNNVSQAASRPRGLYVYNCSAPFQDVIMAILDHIPNHGTPAFFFIDPWGYTDIPFTAVEAILRRPKVEVLLTFFVWHIARFISDSDQADAISAVLGTDKFTDILEKRGYKREQAILNVFTEQIRAAGAQFMTSFRVMHTKARRTAYYLVHTSKHPKAFKKMKEAMWREHTPGLGLCYGGPDHAVRSQTGQLFDTDEFQLQPTMTNHFARREITYSDLEDWVYLNTDAVAKVLRGVLRQMEENGKICVERRTSKVRGFRGQDLIRFPNKRRDRE